MNASKPNQNPVAAVVKDMTAARVHPQTLQWWWWGLLRLEHVHILGCTPRCPAAFLWMQWHVNVRSCCSLPWRQQQEHVQCSGMMQERLCLLACGVRHTATAAAALACGSNQWACAVAKQVACVQGVLHVCLTTCMCACVLVPLLRTFDDVAWLPAPAAACSTTQ